MERSRGQDPTEAELRGIDPTPTTPTEVQVPTPTKAVTPVTTGVPPGGPPSTPEVDEPATPAEDKAPEATTYVTAEVPPGGNPAHTIILVQPGAKPETRTRDNYEYAKERMEGVSQAPG